MGWYNTIHNRSIILSLEEKEMTFKEILEIIEERELKEGKELTLEKRNIQKVKHIINEFETQQLFSNILDEKYSRDLDYSDVVDLQDKLKQLKEVVDIAKEEIDLDEFYKRGELVNFKKLREIYKNKDLKKRYPSFDIRAYEEVLKNPPLEITNFKGEVIKYDSYIVKKLLLGINQMIFDEMDLYLATCGGEGSGKSCWSSQLILYLYTILKKVGLVEYEYDVKKLFYSSLKTMMDVMDEQAEKKDDDYFRIYALDEAYELNRSNYREEASKLFKDSMRADRKLQRILILNLPQLGELELPVIQTRLNFIFDVKMDSDPETGTLRKGLIDLFIMPRGSKIYSTKHRQEIQKSEIINSVSQIMRDKNDSYKGLPVNCIIHQFRFAGVWGFDKEIYDAHIKKENRKRRTEGDIKLTNYQAYLLFRFMPALKDWDKIDKSDKLDKKAYYSIQKFMKKIKTMFYQSRELEENMERRFENE